MSRERRLQRDSRAENLRLGQKLIDRRWFLAAGAIGAGTLLGIRSCISSSLITKPERGEKREHMDVNADAFFNAVPDIMPGAHPMDGVKKFPKQGAAHCFVHLRNIHSASLAFQRAVDALRKDFKDKPTAADRLERFLASPAYMNILMANSMIGREDEPDIDRILRTLIALGAHDIQLEGGITDEMLKTFSDSKEVLKPSGTDRTPRQQQIVEHMKSMMESILGASVFDLYLQGTVEVFPGEDPALLEMLDTNREVIGDNREEPLPDIHERREDSVIKSAASRPVTLQIFGDRHNFLDAIERWNAAHPHDTFSFIEIRPNSITDESYKREREKAQAVINRFFDELLNFR